MAANEVQDAIRGLAKSNPNLDPAILDQIANLFNPTTGKLEIGSDDVMSDEELDHVVGGAGSMTTQYRAAVSSIQLNNPIFSQIAKLNLRMCW